MLYTKLRKCNNRGVKDSWKERTQLSENRYFIQLRPDGTEIVSTFCSPRNQPGETDIMPPGRVSFLHGGQGFWFRKELIPVFLGQLSIAHSATPKGRVRPSSAPLIRSQAVMKLSHYPPSFCVALCTYCMCERTLSHPLVLHKTPFSVRTFMSTESVGWAMA